MAQEHLDNGSEEAYEEEEEEEEGEYYEDYDEEDYYEEEEEDYSDDDEEAAELPELVRDEIDRRKQNPAARLEPPNPLAVHALRQHFESGKSDPMITGGFMSLMRDLGAVAQSKDHLVKNTEHNLWYFGAKDGDTKEWWQDQLQRHESEVRLLRYGEFIEMQETRGLSFEKGYKFTNFSKTDLMEDECKEDSSEEEKKMESKMPASSDKSNNATTSPSSSCIVDDWEVTKEQYEALGKDFIRAFYQYANHDKLQKAGEDATNELLNIEYTDEGIIGRCEELRDRYRDQKRPLGPTVVLEQNQPAPTKKISGKKNRKLQRQQRAKATSNGQTKKGHVDNIHNNLQTLFTMIDQKLVVRPSSATVARIVSAILDMLVTAMPYDKDIARCLAGDQGLLLGDTVSKLRQRTLDYALEADQDEEARPLWAANAWWKCYSQFTVLPAHVIEALANGGKKRAGDDLGKAAVPLSADEKLAARFFETSVMSQLLESVQSKTTASAERCAALEALGKSVCELSVEMVMSLVKQKNTWDLLEASCNCRNSVKDSNKQSRSESGQVARMSGIEGTRSDRREALMAPKAAAKATNLLSRLCFRGMLKDESGGPTTAIVPGPLARKVIQRGIVPLLLKLARTQPDEVVVEAMSGLAQISRAQDCRSFLLQQEDTTELLQTMLLSKEGNKVSHTLLLIVHLLWDKDWRDPLIAIEPPIEETAVKWGAFSMQQIRDRAEQARAATKKLQDDFMSKTLSKVTLSEISTEEKKKLEIEVKKLERQLKKETAWNQLETDECFSYVANYTLSRSLLVLSTMVKGKSAPERIMKVNGLAFGAACLDVPIDETNSAAANVIGNYVTSVGGCSPMAFPDPEHVVSAAISRLSHLVNRQDMSSRSFIFVRLLNGLRQVNEWAPFFQACAEQDIEHKYVIEVFLPKIGANIPSSTPPKKEGRNADTNEDPSVVTKPKPKPKPRTKRNPKVLRKGSSSQCSESSSKFSNCDNCGKVESKAGEFKSCSICFVKKYCGRKLL